MQEFTVIGKNEQSLKGYHWAIEEPKAVIVVIHGMAEKAIRYDAFARDVGNQGYATVAMDLRGHGGSAADGELGHFAFKDGHSIVLDDINRLTDCAADFYPGVPIILFGHSMGCIIAIRSLQTHGDRYIAAVLSGVTSAGRIYASISPAMAGMLRKKTIIPSNFLGDMTFGNFNKKFAPNRTEYDWLSRDPEQVDKYIEDEKCGFICSAHLFRDVAIMLNNGLKKRNILAIPKGIRIKMISGSNDPVGHMGVDAPKTAKRWQSLGLDVDVKVYEGARHELLNEINRDDVVTDLVEFFDRVVL